MTVPPDDIESTLLWMPVEVANGFGAYAVANPNRHELRCLVGWGSHGCARPLGHDGDCWCDCCHCENHPDHDSGCVAGPPYYGDDTRFSVDGQDGDVIYIESRTALTDYLAQLVSVLRTTGDVDIQWREDQ